jgi:hypothetical protein
MKQSIGRSTFGTLALSTVSLVVALSAAACGDDDSGGGAASDGMAGAENGTGGTNGTGGQTNNEVSCDDRTIETLTFDQVFWSAGFQVTLGEARYVAATEECPDGGIAFDAKFENRGTSDVAFNERLILTSQGADYAEYQLDVPEVPGKRIGNGTFAVLVDEHFSLDDMTLLVGGAGEHLAVVPLGEESTETLVSLEPTAFTVPEQFESDLLTFTMKEAVIRADSPNEYTNWAEDTYELRLVLDITSKSDGSENVMDDRFLLELPDGTSVSAASGTINEIVGSGETYQDAVVFFEVPAPAAGTYKLSASAWSTADTEGVLEFEIPAVTALGE